MVKKKLDVSSLDVSSFEVPSYAVQSASIPLGPGGYCCTGCDSGCGYNPTASGCASGGGNTWEVNCGVEIQAAEF